MAVFRTFWSQTVWPLALLLALSQIEQDAVAFDRPAGSSELKEPSGQNDTGLTTSIAEEIQETPLQAQSIGWTQSEVDKGLSKELFLPIQPNRHTADSSIEGSGLEEKMEGNGKRVPSSGALRMGSTDGSEERHLEEGATELPPPPAVPQRLVQRIIRGDDDEEIMIMKRSTDAQSSTPPHAKPIRNDNINTTSSIQMATTVKESLKPTSVSVLLQIHSGESFLNHTSPVLIEKVEHVTLKTTTGTTPEVSVVMSSRGDWFKSDQSPEESSVVSEKSERLNADKDKEDTDIFKSVYTAPTVKGTVEESFSDVQAPLVRSSSDANNKPKESHGQKDDDKRRWSGGVFGTMEERGLSDSSGPCVFGLGQCVVPMHSNGTLLQWEDLRRTLTFAWDLHVFGCAVLFLLVVGVALWGVTGAAVMNHPFSEALTFTNSLLLLEGLLRFVQFIVDPYGTRRILTRHVLTALYNLPIPLLLWAQATLTLLALNGGRTNPLFPALQRPHVTAALATLHVVSLLMADLLSSTLSPAFPLMLQMLSICWGLPLCLGVLFRALAPQRPTPRTPVPWRGTSRWAEERTRHMLMICALLGVLSCALQIHSLLWIYGLLGDWRRFGWGWWLGQFWARLLELAWSFSLLMLGSKMYWKRQGSHRHGDHGQLSARSEREKPLSCWDKVVKSLPAGPWRRRRQENAWADLLPNNWADYQRSRVNISSLVHRNYELPTSVNKKDSNTGKISLGAYDNRNYEPHTSSRWPHDVEWQERDCVLSLIEFDLCPPSPIELRRSIDSTLHYGHLLGNMGSLFTPPPPSWTQSSSSTTPVGGNFPIDTTPTHIAYRWALDAGTSPISPQRFRTVEQCEVSVLDPKTLLSDTTSERKVWERDSVIPAVHEEGDLSSIASGDDVTNL